MDWVGRGAGHLGPLHSQPFTSGIAVVPGALTVCAPVPGDFCFLAPCAGEPTVWLEVDMALKALGFCPCRSLDLTGPLLLGGVPNLPENFPVTHRDFVGCMRDLYIDSKRIDLASYIANNGTTAGTSASAPAAPALGIAPSAYAAALPGCKQRCNSTAGAEQLSIRGGGLQIPLNEPVPIPANVLEMSPDPKCGACQSWPMWETLSSQSSSTACLFWHKEQQQP